MIGKTLRMEHYDSHKIFYFDDFTPQELLNRNEIAVKVIEEHQAICKQCGKSGGELWNSYCK